MARNVEIVVVGGGPAGSATAVALARRGREVLVLERADFPRTKLCGDFIHPYGVAALDRLGVLTELLPRARILRGMKIVSPAGREVFPDFPAGIGLSLSRAVLDDRLLQAARRAGAAVETGRAARAVQRRGGRWQVRTDEAEISARVLVGADGAHSLVARAAGLSGPPPTRGRYAVGLRVRGMAASEGYAEMHLARDAYCGVSMFPDGETNVTMVGRKHEILRRRDLIARGSLDRTAARGLLVPFPALRSRVAAGTITELRATGPLAPSGRPVATDGVLLVGDAADHTDPLTGQGVSMALVSAAVAGEVVDRALTAGNTAAPALSAYARWHCRWGALHRLLRLIDWVALRSPLIEPLARAWGRHPGLAKSFLGIIGNADPVRGVVTPAYLSRLALACIWRA